MYFFVDFFKAGEVVVGARLQLMLVSEKKSFVFLVKYKGYKTCF